jgi:hypothetical protein
MKQKLSSWDLMVKTILILFFLLLNSLSYSQEKIFLTIDVVRAFDSRLPMLSSQDMNQILEEANRIINLKLGVDIEFKINDLGEISLEELFKDKEWQKSKYYKWFRRWKYNMDSPPDFKKYKKKIIEFLKNWNLDDLKKFNPEAKINSYDDFFEDLVSTYKQKIDWLQTLKTESGDSLITKPMLPYNSDREWTSFMWYQNKYDIIITNTLVVYDYFLHLYPHTVYKHAKTGGGRFLSPKREALDGGSVTINILESHGNIPSISRTDTELSRELKNKMAGGFLLAHEFAHAFFLIPDVYDHGSTCLMNTTLENLDYLEGYKILISSLSPCQKCQPWVISKEFVIQAKIAYEKGEYEHSAELYLKGAEKLPKFISGDYRGYMKKLYKRALSTYKKANNAEGIKECKKLMKELKRKESH